MNETEVLAYCEACRAQVSLTEDKVDQLSIVTLQAPYPKGNGYIRLATMFCCCRPRAPAAA